MWNLLQHLAAAVVKLFVRDTQRADFESVMNEWQKIAQSEREEREKLRDELRQALEEIERIRASCEGMRAELRQKIVTLEAAEDECRQLRRHDLARIRELERKVEHLEQQS